MALTNKTIKNALEISNLCKTYNVKGNKVEALKDISLNIPRGSFLVYLDQMAQVRVPLSTLLLIW